MGSVEFNAAVDPKGPESTPLVPSTRSRAELREALVIVNERAGGAALARDALPELEQELRAAGMNVSTHLVPPARVRHLIAQRLGAEPTLVVVGGGDGTLRGAAGLLAKTEHVLGILPLGTMNRFARSLGIPLALEEAFTTLVSGVDRGVDLGSMNGEVFLNTCTLGVYPEIVRVREQRRIRHPGWPRWFRWLLDTTLAAWQVSRGERSFAFRLQLERRALPHRVSAVLVTNNPLPGAKEQRSFNRGLLAIHLPATDSAVDLMSVALRAALLGPTPAEPLALESLEVVLTGNARLWTFPRIPVALDGEVRPAASFLKLESLPLALCVRVPQGKE